MSFKYNTRRNKTQIGYTNMCPPPPYTFLNLRLLSEILWSRSSVKKSIFAPKKVVINLMSVCEITQAKANRKIASIYKVMENNHYFMRWENLDKNTFVKTQKVWSFELLGVNFQHIILELEYIIKFQLIMSKFHM